MKHVGVSLVLYKMLLFASAVVRFLESASNGSFVPSVLFSMVYVSTLYTFVSNDFN